MQRDVVVKGRGLGGSSDLTLLAPIKPGFVESLESVTYKTRIKRVLETLHGSRATAHEYATARLLSDSVERVGAIHSVRVAVVEPEDKVLLAVTFDGSWESYIRVLWDKVGTLLDLIFCGTVGYVTAHEHTFEQWLAWARRVQIETGFFYGPPDSTARDVLYQRRVERMRARAPGTELYELRAVLPSAEDAVRRTVGLYPPEPDDPQVEMPTQERMVRERMRNGLQGLAALYRLADLHRPSTPDGDVLRRATLYLLFEFVKMRDDRLIETPLREARDRFARQLDWLFPDDSRVLVKRPAPPLPDDESPIPDDVRVDVQGGILRAYADITHGLVLLVRFEDVAAAAAFLSWIDGKIASDKGSHDGASVRVFRNIALTPAGLRAAGIGEQALELFPEAFRQGMAARAGQLGDVRNNHPLRWRLPRRFAGIDAAPGNEPIELDTVHVVYQLRCKASGQGLDSLELRDPAHPLRSEVNDLLDVHDGVRLLAVQHLRRRYKENTSVIVEHFGYADGQGQPEVEPVEAPVGRNRIHLGEIVLGHENAADFAIDPRDPDVPEEVKARLRWLHNGSFLVMRKYRQFVDRLKNAVEDTAKEMVIALGGPVAEHREIVYGKLMGRMRDGEALAQATPGPINDFNYDGDPGGQLCPLHAHIRRAHPRLDPKKSVRLPRLMRRSVSYGPPSESGEADRGLVFMAYNASLEEQFEVVQRWLTGGNSTGSSSGESCPVLGVPENGLPRYFRFEHKGRTFRVALETQPPMFDEPAVSTRLEWGMYLFAPSLSVIGRLRDTAQHAAGIAPAAAVPWNASRGRELIKALEKLDDDAAASAGWKAVIEDPESIDRLDSAAIWAAIRAYHGGVLETPYGTLVASRELIQHVLLDPYERYSISGQMERMKRSVGEIYLGMDDGPQYRDESGVINQAATDLTKDEAAEDRVFKIAFDAAKRKIDAIIEEARRQARDVDDARFEVGFDAREVVDEVLGDLCDAWFGLQGSEHFRRGSTDWAWKEGDPAIYPGHFTALSRYMFQPNPGSLPIELGESYGKALHAAMVKFVADHRHPPTVPQHGGNDAPIAAAVFRHPTHGGNDAWVARTMAGVAMGFVAPIIGAVLNVIREWQREGQFAALHAKLAGRATRDAALAVLEPSMRAAARMRPMPQIVWRTVRKAHRLGTPDNGVDLEKGKKVVLALASGTQQSLGDGRDDGLLMFGGMRSREPHPTHACPGMWAGILAVLGALTALLTRTETMRRGPGLQTFIVEGESGWLPSQGRPIEDNEIQLEDFDETQTQSDADDLPAVADVDAAQDDVSSDAVVLDVRQDEALPISPAIPLLPKATRQGLVLAWGDSWLDFGYGPWQWVDLRDRLVEFGYTVDEDFCDWSEWPTAQTMAEDTGQFRDFLVTKLKSSTKPIAILLSAGGNDSTGDSLRALLNDRGSGLPVIKTRELNNHITRLHGYYVKILDMIRKELENPRYGKDIPVLVHGYDYPIPVSKGGFPGWLRRPFFDKGYVDPDDPKNEDKCDVDVATPAMRNLIEALNQMLLTLRNTHRFVRYVKLTGTIETQWPRDPVSGWHNNLHPTADAFSLLALKVDAMLQAPYPGPG